MWLFSVLSNVLTDLVQKPGDLSRLRLFRPLSRPRLFRPRLLNDDVEAVAVRGHQPSRNDDDLFDHGRRLADGGAAAERPHKLTFRSVRLLQRLILLRLILFEVGNRIDKHHLRSFKEVKWKVSGYSINVDLEMHSTVNATKLYIKSTRVDWSKIDWSKHIILNALFWSVVLSMTTDKIDVSKV